MKKLLFSLNPGLRFCLEMTSLALLVYLGLGHWTFPSQILIGLLLPLGFAAIWGRWIAPKSAHRLKTGRRVCLEITLFIGVALLIASTASPSLASVYFLLALGNSLINQWKEKIMEYNDVIPEFMVSDIEKSRAFYCDLLGFAVQYDRPEENFLFLSLEGCQLMIEQGSADELKELTYPLGRGVNISFGIKDVPELYQKVTQADYPIHRPLTQREFRVGNTLIYPQEFAVLDPDGYFLRFSE